MLTTIFLTGVACYGGVRLLRHRSQYIRTRAANRAKASASQPDTSAEDDSTAGKAPDQPKHIVQALIANDELRTIASLTLGSATALTHIALGLQLSSPLFLLNGAGYAVLLAGRYGIPALAPHRTTMHDLLTSYTATTLVLYVLQRGMAGLIAPIGTINKLVELSLLGLLLLDRASWAQNTAASTAIQAVDSPSAALGEATAAQEHGGLPVTQP